MKWKELLLEFRQASLNRDRTELCFYEQAFDETNQYGSDFPEAEREYAETFDNPLAALDHYIDIGAAVGVDDVHALAAHGHRRREPGITVKDVTHSHQGPQA